MSGNSSTAVASCFAITVRVSIRQSYEYRLGALYDAASLRCIGDFQSQRKSKSDLDILILGSPVSDSEGPGGERRSLSRVLAGSCLPYQP
jgi:hypothetical protein